MRVDSYDEMYVRPVSRRRLQGQPKEAAGYLVARRAPWRPRRSAEARPRHRRRRRGAAPSRPGRSNRNFQPSRKAGAKFLPGERHTPGRYASNPLRFRWRDATVHPSPSSGLLSATSAGSIAAADASNAWARMISAAGLTVCLAISRHCSAHTRYDFIRAVWRSLTTVPPLAAVAYRCNTPTGALFLAFQGATEPTPWGARLQRGSLVETAALPGVAIRGPGG